MKRILAATAVSPFDMRIGTVWASPTPRRQMGRKDLASLTAAPDRSHHAAEIAGNLRLCAAPRAKPMFTFRRYHAASTEAGRFHCNVSWAVFGRHMLARTIS